MKDMEDENKIQKIMKGMTLKRTIIVLSIILLTSSIAYSATQDRNVVIHEDVWLAPDNEDFEVSFSSQQEFNNITVTTEDIRIGGDYYDFADPTFGDEEAFDIDADNEVEVVLMDYIKNSYEDTNIKFNVSAVSGTSATIELNNLLDGEGYIIREDGSIIERKIANSSGGIAFSYSGFSTHTLSIDNNEPPTISNYDPADGSTVSWSESKTTQDISFDVSDPDSTDVAYEIYNNDNNNLLDSGSVSPGTNVQYTWNNDFEPSTTYNVRVEVDDGDGGTNTYYRSFTTESNEPPTISNYSPTDGSTVSWSESKTTQEISFDVEDEDASSVEYTIYEDDNDQYVDQLYSGTVSPGSTVSYTWNKDFEPDTTYNLAIDVRDGDGGMDTYTKSFTTEKNDAPSISSEEPENATQIYWEAGKEVTHNVAIDDPDATDVGVLITRNGNTVYDNTVSSFPKTVSFTEPIDSGTSYDWTITADDGDKVTEKTYTYTTQDDIAPTVSEESPTNNAVGIRSDEDLILSADISNVQKQTTDVDIYFEGNLQESTTISSNKEVSATVSSDLLSSDTEYTYRVVAEDENGNKISETYTFRTNRDPITGNYDPYDGERFVNQTDFEFTGNYTDPDNQNGTIIVNYAYQKEDGTWSSYETSSVSNISPGSQWSIPVSIEKGKWYRYYIESDDGAGGHHKSDNILFTTKSLVYIRDEMTGDILDDANITATIRDYDSDFLDQKRLSDGSINLDNYPRDVLLQVNASRGNTTWLRRNFKIPLPVQTSVLLPKAESVIHSTTFEIDDRTGEFSDDGTVVRLKKIAENGTVYEAGSDEIGATGTVTFDLMHGEVYSVKVVSIDGKATSLGTYTAKKDIVYPLKISSFDTEIEDNWYEDISLTYETDTDSKNGTVVNGTVIVRYRDYSNTTLDGTVRIVNQTSEEPILGPYYVNQNQEDITIEIPSNLPIDSSTYSLKANITTDKHGVISKTMPVSFDIPTDKSPQILKGYGNIVSLVLIMGFGLAITKVNAPLAAFVMATMATVLKYFGYLGTSYQTISYAWVLVFMIFIADQRGVV